MCEACNKLYEKIKDLERELEISLSEYQYALWLQSFQTNNEIVSTHIRLHL